MKRRNDLRKFPRRAGTRSCFEWLTALAMVMGCVAAMGDVTLVPSGATWKYLANGTDQGTAWRSAAFDDSGWPSGPAQLGYGDGDEATLLPASPVRPCYYFRHVFTVADPAPLTGLRLSVLRDDGCVVYLNGIEILRTNMPSGPIGFLTWASTASEFGWDGPISTPNTLVVGANVLAVEVHQANATSSDVSLDLQLAALDGLPTVVRGPYLQLMTPQSVIVRWRTSLATNSRVRFGTVAGSLDEVATDAALTTEHSVTLTGLNPDTRYFYTVGTSAADLASGSDQEFFTAPAPGTRQPYRLWVLGDAGTGTAGQAAVRNQYYTFTGSRYTDLILFLGDNAYENGTDTEYQNNVFNVYGSIFRKTPSISTVGNHDTAQSTNPNINTLPYFQIFNLPVGTEGGGLASGTEKYYSYVYGNMRIVCLDSMTSDRSVSGPMLTWLQADLQQNSSDWLIAIWHHPPYSRGSHNSDTEAALVQMRQNALPILEGHGVDLVLAGHCHSYERSYLLDGHYGSSSTLTASMKLDGGSGREDGTGSYTKATSGPAAHQGAVYAVPGSAGQLSGGTLNHPAMFISLNVLGSMVVDVDGDRLDARFIDDQGAVRDYFTILKGETENIPPAVSLVAPANGATLSSPGTTMLQAVALDSDGSVVSVVFRDGETILGVDGEAPWEFAWVDPAVGTHILTTVATDDLGAQASSSPITVNVAPPSGPAGLTATTESSSQIRLAWQDVAGESAYVLERSTSQNFTTALAATLPADTTSYFDTGLTRNTLYYYRIKAFFAFGESAWSVAASARTADVIAPTGLTATAVAASQISLIWSDKSQNETGFVVERSADGGLTFSVAATLGPNATSWVNDGLDAGRTYFYRVRAFNGTGNSDYSNTASATTPGPVTTPPSAPSGLTATAQGKRRIALRWTDTSSTEAGFEVERSVGGGGFVLHATLGANSTELTDSGLTVGITYSYRVRSFNAVGPSDWSGTASATARK